METRQQFLAVEDELERLTSINAEHRAEFEHALREGDADNPEFVDLLIELGAGIVQIRDGIRRVRVQVTRDLDRLDEVATLQMLQSIPMPDFSDDELLAAINQAQDEWNKRGMTLRAGDPKDAIWAAEVARVLAGRAATKAEVSRVVHRLRKLEAASRVEKLTFSYGAALWRVRADA